MIAAVKKSFRNHKKHLIPIRAAMLEGQGEVGHIFQSKSKVDYME